MRRAWPALFVLAACARAEVPPEAGAVEAGAPPRTMTLALRDAPVQEVLEAASHASEQAVVIDPNAQLLARCARITVLTGKPVAGDELFALLAEAMRPVALDLVKASTGGWILRRNAAAPPPVACGDAPAVTGAPPPSAEVPLPSPADPATSAKIVAGIKRISDTEFEVTESARDLFLQKGGVTSARIIPEIRDGGAVGLRLFGVRPTSPLAALGIVNGDTVKSVNGSAIASPDQALEAYSRLRRAERFSIQLERQGKPVEIVVRVVRDAVKPK